MSRASENWPSNGETLTVDHGVLTLSHLVRYAGASGDFHPLHHDDRAARAMGLDGVIGHGMLSAGLLTSAITRVVPVELVTALDFRFLEPTRLDERLTSVVTVTGVHSVGEHIVVELAGSLTGHDGAAKVTARVAASFTVGECGPATCASS